MKKLKSKSRFMLLVCSLFAGCQDGSSLPAIAPVPQVELTRFMGSWYVLACIPTVIEHNIYNAQESYSTNADGTIATTFSFNQGRPEGKQKTYHPVGYVKPDSGNAVWGMQFIWPIRAEYLITYLDQDYSRTIIARNARDYVWIMARSPSIPQQEYDDLVAKVAALGYDTNKLVKIPQALANNNGSPS